MTFTINDIILFLLIGSSVYFDLTQRRIPNFITFPVILWGLLTYSIFEGFEGFKFSILGFLVGLGILLIPFMTGGMGGGDVKLMAAIGALKGWRFVLFTTLYTAVSGGIIVIIYLIYKRKLGITLKRIVGMILRPILFILTLTFNNKKLEYVNNNFLGLDIGVEKSYIPYGVAIGLGVILVYINGVIK